MAEPNWGLLEKSQVDNETIEEAIDRLIAAHDDDANAHIGEGKSLDTHKTQATVDHPADSVIEDKIKDGNVTTKKFSFERFYIHTQFESIDGWAITAGVSIYAVSQMVLETGAVINTTRRAHISTADWNDGGGAPADSPEFQTTVRFKRATEQVAYIGQCEPDDPFGWGFKIVDGTLYAWYTDNDNNVYTQEIAGITLTDWNVYRCVFTGGSKIEFYVNGVLKHTATTNLPTFGMSTFITYQIENTEAVDKEIFVQDLLYIQDFFQ